MKRQFLTGLALTFALAAGAQTGWTSLFDGKTLNGWKVGKHAETFSVQDGAIVANGQTAHLFYEGPVHGHNFKNFEFKADVMTMPGSNSGIYFHTVYQDSSWPSKGYEVQVNNSHTDWRRTGSLYAVQDVKEVYVRDGEWFTESFTVQGKHVTISINGKMVVDYTEPEHPDRPASMAGRLLSSGTFALQGHDPGSKVFFKNIYVRPLPDGDDPASSDHAAAIKVMQLSADQWNRGDMEGYMKLYDRSATMTSKTGLRDFAAIRKAMLDNYFVNGKPKQQLAFDQIETRALGPDFMLLTGRFTLSGGNLPELSGRYSLVLQRTSTGWKIIHDHSS